MHVILAILGCIVDNILLQCSNRLFADEVGWC